MSRAGAEPEDPEVVAARKAKREQVKTLRAKLIKFVQAVPVFMYLTDFREEALRRCHRVVGYPTIRAGDRA